MFTVRLTDYEQQLAIRCKAAQARANRLARALRAMRRVATHYAEHTDPAYMRARALAKKALVKS